MGKYFFVMRLLCVYDYIKGDFRCNFHTSMVSEPKSMASKPNFFFARTFGARDLSISLMEDRRAQNQPARKRVRLAYFAKTIE